MSAYTANPAFHFKLPQLSYIDAKWEEPNLRTFDARPQSTRGPGVTAWLRRQASAVMAWSRNTEAAAQLAAMSDYQLADIGLTRSDLARVFQPDFSEDLSERGTPR